MNEEIGYLKNVNVKFGKKLILENINLSLKKNEFLSIIGPNGSGKTTLIKALLGLVKISSGLIKIKGYSPGKYPKCLIGYLPQGTTYNILFPAKVKDIVIMGRFCRIPFLKFPSENDYKKVDYFLDIMGMLPYREENFQDLSGGMKQRVLIARALVSEPEILILDEPSTGLDLISQKDLYEILNNLKKKMTIIVVSHDIGVISQYVDKIVCLNKKIHYFGKVDKYIPPEIIRKVFGENIMFIVHDKECLTCIRNKENA